MLSNNKNLEQSSESIDNLTISNNLQINTDIHSKYVYGMFEIDKTLGIKHLEITTTDYNKFIKALNVNIDLYYADLSKNFKNISFVIFKTNEPNIKIDDFKFIKYAFPCVKLTLKGFDLDIVGNNDLIVETVNKIKLLVELQLLNIHINRLCYMNYNEIVSYLKSKERYSYLKYKNKSKNTIIKKIYNYECYSILDKYKI